MLESKTTLRTELLSDRLLAGPSRRVDIDNAFLIYLTALELYKLESYQAALEQATR